jgi:hypothetical protein
MGCSAPMIPTGAVAVMIGQPSVPRPRAALISSITAGSAVRATSIPPAMRGCRQPSTAIGSASVKAIRARIGSLLSSNVHAAGATTDHR